MFEVILLVAWFVLPWVLVFRIYCNSVRREREAMGIEARHSINKQYDKAKLPEEKYVHRYA